MITVITRTANRTRFFAECRRSVLEQTERPYHLVISDTPEDDYPEGDLVLRVPRQEGRGHNLYFNQVRKHIPRSHPWVMFLDDDDAFHTRRAVQMIQERLYDANDMVLWQVLFPDNLQIPGGSMFLPPQPGKISGIGFCYHSWHWEDWKPEAYGDYHVINALYSQLHPVWINAVLTRVQEIGHGQRKDATHVHYATP